MTSSNFCHAQAPLPDAFLNPASSKGSQNLAAWGKCCSNGPLKQLKCALKGSAPQFLERAQSEDKDATHLVSHRNHLSHSFMPRHGRQCGLDGILALQGLRECRWTATVAGSRFACYISRPMHTPNPQQCSCLC